MPTRSATPFGLSALHVATLFSLAVAHPLYDLLVKGDHATFFVAHQSQPIDIWLLVLSLSVLVPLALAACVWLTSWLSAGLAAALYAALLSALAAVFLLHTFSALLPVPGAVSALLALITGLALALLYRRRAGLRTFVSFMSPLIVVSPWLFLKDPAIASLVRAPTDEAGERRVSSLTLPDIVILVFDELPLISLLADERSIDAERYPNFGRLAATSTWYRNATTIHYSTRYSIPSILTGRDHWSYMRRFHLDRVENPGIMLDTDDFPDNVFTLFEGTHDIYASLSTTRVSTSKENVVHIPPLSRRVRSLAIDLSILYAHQITPDPFREGLPPIGGQWQDFLTSQVDPAAESRWPYPGGKAGRIRQLLDHIRERRRPSLYVAHVVLPHRPFRHNERGQIHEDPTRIPDDRVKVPQGRNVWTDEYSASLAYQAHLLQLAFTDRLLGHVLDRLEAGGLLRDALLVVTADHGISFYWDGEGLSSQDLYAAQASEILYVPLFVKAPGQTRARISDRMVQTIDILPTIADLLEVPIPWQIDGASALDGREPAGGRFAWLMSRRREFDSVIDPDHRALQRKIALFGNGDLERVYHSGPHPEMVGRPLSDWPSVDSQAIVELQDPEKFHEVDLAGSAVPAYVQGEIVGLPTSEGDSGPVIAVAVNGTIGNTTRARWEAGRLRFLTRIPPQSFVSGRNEITLHAIVADRRGEPASLARLARE